MKIEKYAQMIIEIARKHPKAEVLYSIDDEGNDFREVHYAPSYNTFELGNGKNVKGICIN